LLSRIDGAIDERDLALVTGLSPMVVDDALERLRALGAVDLGDGARAAPAARPAQKEAVRQPVASPRKVSPLPGERSPHPPPAARVDPRVEVDDPPPRAAPELEEIIELAPDKRGRIRDLFTRLDDLTHYELLGVAEGTDKKQIKSAYYALAPEFHPDTYFRK